MTDLNELRSRVKALHDVLGLNVLADVLCLIDESGGLEMTGGYVWAWLKDDASGEVHHPLILPTAQDQFETWPELVGRNEPDALGRRVKLYRLVEVRAEKEAGGGAVTQHMILTGRSALTGADGRMLTACGRRVGPESGTSWQQTTCRACRRSLAWWKASEE